MQINNLIFTNWRNFSSKKITFDQKLTAIIGKNGSGKSNILEAVAMLSGIRPTRVETDLDLVKFGRSDSKVEGSVSVDGETRDLIINLQVVDSRRVGKSFYIDAFKKRLFDFVEIFSVVVFEPADLDLVSGSPSLRRKHVDRFLSSIDSKYWRAASAYAKIVTRRNKILWRISEGKAKPMELGFWDARLLDYARFISKVRQEFFEYLNFVNTTSVIASTSNTLSVNSAKQSKKEITASSSTPRNDEEAFRQISWQLKQSLVTEEKLKNNRERDIAAGVTLSGPHRDDFRFIFQGRDLEFFGSRGEQRMAVLALKLAELEYHKVKRGVRPVLALDDIFSELDWEHRETVLSVIGNQQTIITAAEKESIPREIFKKASLVEI